MTYRRTPSDNKKATKRSAEKKKAACMGDLLHAAFIQFVGNSRYYLAADNPHETENMLYEDDNGTVTLIGFLKQLPKGKVQVSRRMFGLNWISIFKYSEVTCIGTKKRWQH